MAYSTDFHAIFLVVARASELQACSWGSTMCHDIMYGPTPGQSRLLDGVCRQGPTSRRVRTLEKRVRRYLGSYFGVVFGIAGTSRRAFDMAPSCNMLSGEAWWSSGIRYVHYQVDSTTGHKHINKQQSSQEQSAI